MSDDSKTLSPSQFVLDVANKLATWRKKSRSYWYKIVALIDIHNGDVTKFDSYDEFSSELNLEQFKKTNEYANISMTQMFEWMKEDNKEFYDEIKIFREEIMTLVINFTEAQVSRIFYNLKPNNYIYIDELGWYSVNENNIWIHNEKVPTHMAIDIDRTMTKFITDSIVSLNDEEKKILEDFEISREERIKRTDDIDEKRKEYRKILNKFGKEKLSKSMITYLKSYYNNNEALNFMDSNPNYFACNNKVFDCLTCEWRDIKPTDYISMNTGYSYSPKRDKTIQTKILEFFDSCFESSDVAEYFLSIIARCLYGHRDCESAQKFYILKGNGRNGKGLSFKLITRLFGGEKNYFKSIDNKELTKVQTKANEPLPGLANCRGKRCVLTTEPEDNEHIQVAIVKKITGGDTLQFRDLFQRGKGCEFTSQFGLFFQTNHNPYFKLDSAFLNRLVVINFPFKFKSKDEYDESNPSEKLADNNLGMLFNRDDYRLEFLHILIDIFKKHNLKDEAMKMPELVKEYTKEVVGVNNLVGVWLEKNYKPKSEVDINDTNYWVKTTELLATFKSEMNSGMSDKEFISQMEHNKFMVTKASKAIESKEILKNNSIFKGIHRVTPKSKPLGLVNL